MIFIKEKPTTSLLEIKNLTMRFGGVTAVDDVSFTANGGDITAVIGPNGAGKTTLFNCITGFYKPTEGQMLLNLDKTRYLHQMKGHHIASAGVARTFQNIRLFPKMTALENLLVAQHNALMKASFYSVAGVLGLPRYKQAEKTAIERAKYWLEKTNLLSKADHAAGDLPYGEQRHLEIARAMCMQPKMLCLDEPAAGLNPKESFELKELIKKIRDEAKIGVLLIEHDMGVVMGISDKIIVLEYGRKIADGKPEDIRNNKNVIRAYLGEEDDAA